MVLPDMVAGDDDDPDARLVPEEHEFGVVRAVSVRQRRGKGSKIWRELSEF
jgi:hypothetical protein